MSSAHLLLSILAIDDQLSTIRRLLAERARDDAARLLRRPGIALDSAQQVAAELLDDPAALVSTNVKSRSRRQPGIVWTREADDVVARAVEAATAAQVKTGTVHVLAESLLQHDGPAAILVARLGADPATIAAEATT